MRRAIFAGIITVMLVGCGNGEHEAISQAQKAVANMLKDPDSAKFSNVHFRRVETSVDSQGDGYVCGYVNGKNAFGAYAGAVRFVAKAEISKSGAIIVDAQVDDGNSRVVPGRIETPFEMIYWNPGCVAGYQPSQYVAEATQAVKDKIKWAVQLARLSSKVKADEVKGKVESIGISVYITTIDGMNIVFAGPFEDRELAESKSDEISRKIKLNGFVIRAN